MLAKLRTGAPYFNLALTASFSLWIDRLASVTHSNATHVLPRPVSFRFVQLTINMCQRDVTMEQNKTFCSISMDLLEVA